LSLGKLGSVRLETRLQTVADLINAPIHLDIGSDHAHLPLYLLQSGRIQKAFVIEKNLSPFKRSQKALESYCAEVRLGDGLEPVQKGEVDSLSLCGLGALRIAKILAKHPERVPPKVVLQSNDTAEPLRVWASESGFHLKHEDIVQGFWRYNVLAFVKAEGNDAAYHGVPKTAALRYGPLLLKAQHPLLLAELQHQRHCLSKLPAHPQIEQKLELIDMARAYFT